MKKRFIAIVLCLSVIFSVAGCTSMISSLLSDDSENYQAYVQSVLDLYYKGETDRYLELTETEDEKEALDIYNDNIDSYADAIMAYFNVDKTAITEEVQGKYALLAKTLLSKVNYTVNEATCSDDDYYVKVDIKPMDFFVIATDPAVQFVENFNNGYDLTNYNNWTVDENALYETAYAEGMYKVISELVDDVSYKDVTSVICEIEVEDNIYGVDDDIWSDIDSKLFIIEEE